MKISHSASPRNRSSRSSRSPPTGIEMAVDETVRADAASPAIASAVSASLDPEIRSAMDVIWHHFEVGSCACSIRKIASADTTSPRVASKIAGLWPRQCALGRNYVETAICNLERYRYHHAGRAIGSV